MSTATQERGSSTKKPAETKNHVSDRARQERNLGWKLAAPAFVIMLAVTAYPILQAIYESFFNYRLTAPDERSFIFLKNYAVILTDPLWWQSVGFTVAVTIVTLVVEFVIGMAFAMVMNRIVIPRRTLRTLVLIPYAIITVVSAFTWQFMFSTSSGFMNGWLHFLTFGLVPTDFDWFGSTLPAFVVICLSEIWKTTPFMSLLLLAGLAQIDGALEEAARVDGATFWERLTRVILPNMKAAIMVALLFRALDAFRIFDNIFIMTGGSAGTNSVSILAYNQTIASVQIGMGSAISVLIFVLVLGICALFIKGFKVDLAASRGG